MTLSSAASLIRRCFYLFVCQPKSRHSFLLLAKLPLEIHHITVIEFVWSTQKFFITQKGNKFLEREVIKAGRSLKLAMHDSECTNLTWRYYSYRVFLSSSAVFSSTTRNISFQNKSTFLIFCFNDELSVIPSWNRS